MAKVKSSHEQTVNVLNSNADVFALPLKSACSQLQTQDTLAMVNAGLID